MSITTIKRPAPRERRCLVLARDVDDAISLTRAPRSDFTLIDQLPIPVAQGAYVLPCPGYHGYGSTINAQIGGRTVTIAWRLRAGDPARRLVNVLVDSPNPGAVVQAAYRLYEPVTRVVITPEMAVPLPDAVTPVAEETVPPLASQKVSLGPWSLTMFAIVREEADRADVAPAFMLALVHEESRFNPLAVNPTSGAMGLGQLMPATAEQHGVRDPFDPRQNVRGAIAHVKHLASRVDSPTTILAAYRAGLGNVRRRGISQNDWAYVRRVVTHWRMYERILRDQLITEDPIGTVLIFK
jgi:hypothetical protein